MVVRVVVPTRKVANSEGLMSDAAVLLDPDASADEVLKALRRTAALAKSPKFVQGGSKVATPVIKAVLAIIRSRGAPSDEQVLLAVFDTLAVLCKAVKGAAIIVRLEGGLPHVTSLIALHIKRTSFQRGGFSCLAALAASPQNAIAIAKAGAVQAVLVVLNDNQTKYFGADSMDAATLGLQLLSSLIKASDSTLPMLGTQLILQAVVNAIYARVGNKKVVTAATEVLYLVVKRHTSEDVSEAMMQRYSEKVREAGGVDAMLVVIGRYSDCPDLFKLAYAVLNRLQRSVLTAEILGEFPEARSHLTKVSAEDPFNGHLLFPEMQEFTTNTAQFLDAEHAAALPHRGVPETISGARGMIKGAGVHAAWSRNCSSASKREPFLPPVCVCVALSPSLPFPPPPRRSLSNVCYICTYAYAQVYTHNTQTNKTKNTHTHMRISRSAVIKILARLLKTYTPTNTNIYVHIHIYMYIRKHMYVRIHIYTYIYIYTCIYTNEYI